MRSTTLGTSKSARLPRGNLSTWGGTSLAPAIQTLPFSSGVEVYLVDAHSNSYPIDWSDTIHVRQDPTTKFVYLDLSPTVVSQLAGYATSTSPTFTGTVSMGPLNITYNGIWGAVQVAPTTDNSETGIGFYRYANKQITNAGDAWVVGQGSWGNAGSFVIGTAGLGACLTINTSGVVNIANSLTISGTDVMNKFNSYATLASPALTGSPTAPTQATSDSSTKLATTAYVQTNLHNFVNLTSAQSISGLKTFSGGLLAAYGSGNGCLLYTSPSPRDS